MYIIAGLGNPGKEYENTRHNIGFDVIDRLAEEENIAVMESKHKALIGKGYVAGQKVILAKPQTFMNLSGESIREIVDYYKVDDTAELIVISDDISLDLGEKPKNFDLADYVLGHFPAEERNTMDEAAKTAAEAIRMIITENADAAMNHFNSKKA